MTVENPATWADSQLSNLISTFFWDHEEDYVEADHYSETQDLRSMLVGQASVALRDFAEARSPLLKEIDEAGPHNPMIRGLIKRDFGTLAEQVTEARIAVPVKKTESNETVPERFCELASLTPYEIKRLLREALWAERKIGVSRRIAAELVGGRCALDGNTVLKYAQPGQPKANRKKKI